MSNIYTGPKAFNPSKPAMTLWEDGNWLRIEDQRFGTRYLPKAEAIAILQFIGTHSQKEKSELVLTP
jgi:hypothetical protein